MDKPERERPPNYRTQNCCAACRHSPIWDGRDMLICRLFETHLNYVACNDICDSFEPEEKE
jgi:hypothetical protein